MTTNTNTDISTILEPIRGELTKEHKAMYTGLLDSVIKRLNRGSQFNNANAVGLVDSHELDLAVEAYWYRRVLNIVADENDTIPTENNDEDAPVSDLELDEAILVE